MHKKNIPLFCFPHAGICPSWTSQFFINNSRQEVFYQDSSPSSDRCCRVFNSCNIAVLPDVPLSSGCLHLVHGGQKPEGNSPPSSCLSALLFTVSSTAWFTVTCADIWMSDTFYVLDLFYLFFQLAVSPTVVDILGWRGSAAPLSISGCWSVVPSKPGQSVLVSFHRVHRFPSTLKQSCIDDLLCSPYQPPQVLPICSGWEGGGGLFPPAHLSTFDL